MNNGAPAPASPATPPVPVAAAAPIPAVAAAATATVAAPVTPASRKPIIRRFDVASFDEKPVDKLKGYLRDVPVLHARLVRVINEWEGQLTKAKADLAEFQRVTEGIKSTVAKWEKDDGHGGSDQPSAPAAATPTGAGNTGG